MNLEKFLTSRKLIAKIPPIKSESEFIKRIQGERTILIEATDAPGKQRASPVQRKLRPVLTYIFLTDTDVSDEFKSQQLVKMVNSVDPGGKKRQTANIEIIIILYDEAQKFIEKKINQINADSVEKDGGYMYIFAYPYKLLLTPIFEHSMVPPHFLMTPAEVAEFLEYDMKRKIDYGRLRLTDPAAAWLDARTGDIVKIINPSEVSGKDFKYRHVW